VIRRLWARDRDEGAVATVVGLLLSGGVLLGFMALVVDVGQIYVERGELISGADAAALGVAKACATDLPACDTVQGVWDLAQRYADDNATDHLSHVAQVCGVMAGILLDCPAPASNRTACLGEIPSAGNWVEVRLTTEVPGNRFVLPPSFAGAVIEGFDGTSVGACARVAWREPVVVDIMKIAMSDCAFAHATRNGFANLPPYPPYPNPNRQEWLGMSPSCPGSNGSLPSAAVLGEPGGSCQFVMPENGFVDGSYLRDEDTTVGGDCRSRLRAAGAANEVVYLPVYDRAGPPLRIVRLAAVVVTGFDLGTDPDDQYSNGNRGAVPDDCRPDAEDEPWQHRCISIVVVGQLELSALVADAAIDLIG
jgi:hypothetical protein